MRRLLLAFAIIAAFALGSFLPSTPQGASWIRPQTILAQDDCQTFPETGKTVCGIFLSYWRANGSLAQQGFPVSDVFQEKSSIDGKTYDVQYFERAVFERHPENAGTKFEVLLSLLGREKFERQYPAGRPGGEVSLQAGQTVVLPGDRAGNTLSVTITSVERTQSIDTTNANGAFIAVSMTVTNLGTESDKLATFKIKDKQGRTFDQSIDGILAGIGELPGDNILIAMLQPSTPSVVYTVFDVATDATEFTIVPAKK